MAATKCVYCNNRTTDPSGRCYLHKSGRWQGEDNGRAKTSAEMRSMPPAATNSKHPPAPAHMQEDLIDYVDLNDRWSRLDAVRNDLTERLRRLPSGKYEFSDGTAFRSSSHNLMDKKKADAFLRSLDEVPDGVYYQKLTADDVRRNHPELAERATFVSDDMTLYVGGVTADYTDVYNEPHPEHDGLEPEELYRRWDDVSYKADEVRHDMSVIEERLKDDFDDGDAYSFNGGTIRAAYSNRLDMKEVERIAEEEGIDLDDSRSPGVSTPGFRKAFPEQAAKFTRAHGGKFTPLVRHRVFEAD